MFSFSFTWVFIVVLVTLVSGEDDLGILWDDPVLTNVPLHITWTRDFRRDTSVFDVIFDPPIPGQEALSVNAGNEDFSGDVGTIVPVDPGSYQLQVVHQDDHSDIFFWYDFDVRLNRHATTIAITSSPSTPSTTVEPTVATIPGTTTSTSLVKMSKQFTSTTLSSTGFRASSPSSGSSSSTTMMGTPISGASASSSTSSGPLPTTTQDRDHGPTSSQVTGNTANATPNSIKIILPTVLVIVFIVLLLIFWIIRRRSRLLKPEPFQPPSEDRLVQQDDTESHPDMTEHIDSSATDSIIINPPYRVLSSSNSGHVVSDVKSIPSLETDQSLMAPTSAEGTILTNDSEAMQARIAALEQAQHDAEMQISRLRAQNEVWRRNRDSDEVSLATSPPSYTPP